MKNLGLSLLGCLLLLFAANNTHAQQRLTKSIKAPSIALKDVTGEKVNLQTMTKGDKKVLICFFRPVWCPICNHRTHELIGRYKELQEKGIDVIAVYPSKQETMAQYVKDAKIPFTVISDPDEVLYKKYSIERSMAKAKKTMTQEGIKDVIQKGMEAYKGKSYPKKDDKYTSIINADFLIGAKRAVEIAYYGEYVGDHYNLDKL